LSFDQENARTTRWCYTRFPEYAFIGGVIILPELAANPAPMSLKRNLTVNMHWIGQELPAGQLLLEGTWRCESGMAAGQQ